MSKEATQLYLTQCTHKQVTRRRYNNTLDPKIRFSEILVIYDYFISLQSDDEPSTIYVAQDFSLSSSNLEDLIGAGQWSTHAWECVCAFQMARV